MTQRDIRAGRHPYTFTVLDFVKEELHREPLRLRDVAAFLVGLAMVMGLLVLSLATGGGR